MNQDLLVVAIVVPVQDTSLAHQVLSNRGISLDVVKVGGIGTHGQQGENRSRLEHHGYGYGYGYDCLVSWWTFLWNHRNK
jgi:hypothetical protein